MLDLRDKRIEQLPIASAQALIEGRAQTVTGRVVAQTFETDPMLDIRVDGVGIVHVRMSAARIEMVAA